MAKSSGFSSFSSLLSSNDQPIRMNSRSSSMPSIRFTTFSSVDSSNLSYDNVLDSNDLQCHSNLVIENETSDISKQLNSQQSFITCFEGQENNKSQINILQKRFPSADLINEEERTKERLIILKEKHKSGKNVYLD
jgi:hypothetical protein